MLQYFLGSSFSAFTVTTSGGPVAGSAIDQPVITFSPPTSGGPVVGEEDDTPTILFAVASSGGPVVGEQDDTATLVFTVSSSGGPVVGEEDDTPSIVFTPATSGGTVVGEQTESLTIVFSPASSGGPVVSETVQGGGSTLVVGIGGGPVVGSTVDPPVLGFARPSSGGPVVGETLAPNGIFTGTSSAGILVGEIGQGLVITAVSSSAALLIASVSSPAVVGFTAVSTGGPVVGEVVQPSFGFSTIAGTGGILVGSDTHGFIGTGSYHIYENHGIGDAVDYDFPVETTSLTTWTTGSLPFPGDYSFHVRAFWDYNLDEEHNLDARVRVILDATGADVTGRPAAPTGLAAQPIKGGQVRLSWLYKTPSGRATPSRFNVYTGTPGVSYAAFVQQIAYGSDGRYFAVVTGLTSGRPYQFVVRAANSTAEETNTNIVTATPDATGPNPPQNLIATSI